MVEISRALRISSRVKAGVTISSVDRVRLLGVAGRLWNLDEGKIGVEVHLGIGIKSRITTRISLRFPKVFENAIDAMMRDGQT